VSEAPTGYGFPHGSLPMDVERMEALVELALDMRWSWNHSVDALWQRIDPALWELTYNPWMVLQTVSRDRIKQVLADAEVHALIDDLLESRRRAAETPAWFQQNFSKDQLSCVAYFCMEFMLSEALPIYSGGLGNAAGDQLKAASDLGVPVVGVGLLYQQGYFRQVIDRSGNQHALFPYNEPGQLPITALREPNGERLRLEVAVPGYSVWVRAWEVQVGGVKLYLLDTNDPANFPAHRGITSELYGEGEELRLSQEMLLGIGGWRLLKALGLAPEVCHLNEGHCSFAILERARSFMEETGQPFEVALAATRAGNIFTTHTPVAAGFDRFPPALIEQYLGTYARQRLGIPVDRLLALGRENPDDPAEPFNMAYLALRGCGAVNGVSRLHGRVSRRIFQPLFPRWPETEVPVGHVTNGVHMPTWESAASDTVWAEACTRNRWLGTLETMEQDLMDVSDSQLWEFRTRARSTLIDYVRERASRHLEAIGGTLDEANTMRGLFDANTLTLGFARRFATYKRPTLLLHDPARLLRILTNPKRPVQLVIAGKAHPADVPGQAMIRQWADFMALPGARGRAVFLSDHDMLMTQRLVQGVDVWINTPRRPWEACGTSGMKVLVNGGVNLSELDGWWAEAYEPEVGWPLGDGKEHGDDAGWDAAEAERLYELLETEVVPQFYTRDENGIPAAWVARVRESMARLTPRYSSNRVVRQYTEEYYVPAAGAYRRRSADVCKAAVEILKWRHDLERKWANLRFGAMKVETGEGQHHFSVQVYLDDIDLEAISVQLYAEGPEGTTPEVHEMARGQHLVGAVHGYTYSCDTAAARPASDYTPRIVPHRAGVAVPLEAPEILWQR
jgi:starch phosphorylase